MARCQILRIVLILDIAFGINSFAQTDYYEASGEAPTLEQARQQALKYLTNSIQTFIQTRFESRITENKGTITEDFTNSQTTTYSGIILKNVAYTETHNKKGWVVTARVSKADVQKAFDQRQYAIRSLVNIANVAERSGDFATALRNYFWAYVLTFSYPDTIQISISNTTGDAATLIPAHLNAIFKGMTATVEKSFVDGDDFIAIVKLTCGNLPVTNLQVSYYDGTEQNWCEVINERVTFVLRGEFSDQSTVLRPQIEYRYVSDMEQNPEVNQIYQFLKLPEFDNSFPVMLDLRNYVTVDFTATFRGYAVYFQPQLQHLSVKDYHWEFGDGRTSSLAQPAQTFATDRNYQIKLTINGKPNLSCIKILDPKNQTLTATEISTVKESRPKISKSRPSSAQLLTELREVNHLQDFVTQAQRLSREGRIVFGASKDFENKEGLYCFIFNSKTAELKAILTVQKGEFINIKTLCPELLSDYKGNRAIWVEVLQ